MHKVYLTTYFISHVEKCSNLKPSKIDPKFPDKKNNKFCHKNRDYFRNETIKNDKKLFHLSLVAIEQEKKKKIEILNY